MQIRLVISFSTSSSKALGDNQLQKCYFLRHNYTKIVLDQVIFFRKDAKHFRPLITAMKFELSNGIFLNRFLKTFLLKGSTSKTDKNPKTFKGIKLDSLFSYFLGG